MRKIIALLATTICAPALAADPTTQLPDLVVTATRVPTPVRDIPAGVTVIDRAAIEAGGFNTLVDAMAAVPGLRISPSGGPGGQASVFIRGTNSNHVLVLRDGMPINDPSEANGAFNFGVETLSDIERIEVIRGPMAALYGSGAIGGVINLISRRGTEPGSHVVMDLSGGYPAQVRGAVSATGTEGPFDYALTAESQSQRGFDSNPQRMHSYTGTPQGFRDRVGTFNVGYSPVEGTRISLFLRARQALFGFNALGTPTFDTANSSGTADSLLGRIGMTSTLFGGTLETSLVLGRQQDDRHYVEPLAAADPNQAATDSRYHSRRTDLQWNNTLHLNRFIRSEALSATSLTFGYQHLADSITLRVKDSFFGFPFAQDARASMTNDAVHAGLQTTLWDRLTVTGQIRQDWVADNAPLTWRLGAVLDTPELATRFKTAYGTTFRAPSLFDRFGVDSFGYVGNPSLKPESAQGWEAGFATTLPAFGRLDFITLGTTYFNQQVQNLIVAVFSPVNTAVNVGSAHVQGFETEISLHPAAWLTFRISHTFTDAQNADNNSRLLRRPQHSGSVDATISPLPGLRIVPALTYTGAFRDALSDNDGNFLGNGTNHHGLIGDLTMSYDVTPRVQLYTTGRNIFGSRFESVNGFQTPGTSVIAGVRLKL
jgi:vitamin B12 transporter